MSNVANAKPRVKTITLNDGVERELKFTLNAMAELEDRYGSVDKAFEAVQAGSIKAIRCVMWAGLLAGDDTLTEQRVGALIDLDCINSIMETMSDALGADVGDEQNPDQPVALPNS